MGADRRAIDPQHLTSELLIAAYSQGIFPMVDSRSGEVGWYSPDPRAIFPLDSFHVPRSLARVIRAGRFELRTDTCFETVMRACAEPRRGREETWIDERMVTAYAELWRGGLAHSVEAWRDERLVGGLYGVHIGSAFFGESMFSLPELGGTNASKVCLVGLLELLRERGFSLLDTQFSTEHLSRFGCVELPRDQYLQRLDAAIRADSDWPDPGPLRF